MRRFDEAGVVKGLQKTKIGANSMESSWRRWYVFVTFLTSSIAVYAYGEFFLDLCLGTWYEDLGRDSIRYRSAEEIAGVYLRIARLWGLRVAFPRVQLHLWVGLANSLYPVEYRVLGYLIFFSLLRWIISIGVGFRYSGTVRDRWDFEEEDLFVYVPTLVDYLSHWLHVFLVFLFCGQLPVRWVIRALYVVHLWAGFGSWNEKAEKVENEKVDLAGKWTQLRWLTRLSFLITFVIPVRISGFVLFDDLFLLLLWWVVSYGLFLGLSRLIHVVR